MRRCLHYLRISCPHLRGRKYMEIKVWYGRGALFFWWYFVTDYQPVLVEDKHYSSSKIQFSSNVDSIVRGSLFREEYSKCFSSLERKEQLGPVLLVSVFSQPLALSYFYNSIQLRNRSFLLSRLRIFFNILPPRLIVNLPSHNIGIHHFSLHDHDILTLQARHR